MAFGNLGSIWASIGLETTKLQKGVSVAKLQLSTLDKQTLMQAASINAKLQTIGTGLQSVGKKMSMYVTLPIMAMGAASVKAGMDFEDSMTKSLAIMGNISPQIRAEMEKTAKSVVDYTTFSAKEGADAYFYLASAGLDAAQSIEALPRVAKFAQAGQFDLALATDLLTDAQSALGLTIHDDVIKNMENMTRVSDVLVKANTLSNATVQQFSESLTNKAGAALKLLNKDIEEGTAVLAAWADQGVKGAEAGNWLNIVLRDLQRAAIENGDVFEKFGISVFDTNGNVRNMADVIGDLETALEGMSDKEARATLMMLGFQDRSISAMLTLLGTSDAIRTYEESLRDATGFTEDVAKKQMESFTASAEQLKNQLINVGISIFDIVKPRLESLLDLVRKGIDWFNNLSDSQKNMLVNLGLITAATGPLLYGLGAMIRTVSSLRTGFIALNVATKGWLSTMSWIAAAAVASYYLNKYFIGLTDTLREQNTQWSRLSKNLIEGTFLWTGIYNKIKDIKLVMKAKNELSAEEIRLIKEQSSSTDEFISKLEDVIGETEEVTQKYADADEAIKDLTEQNLELGYAEETASAMAEEQATQMGYLEEQTDDTTDSIDEQKQALEELRQEFNDLINDIFGLTNAENDLEEAQWAVEDAQKALTEAIKEHGEGSREAKEKENDLDDAYQKELDTLFELYNQEELNIDRKRELRNEIKELLTQIQETSGLSQNEFVDMAKQFDISANEIFRLADEMGINLDVATRYRIVDIDVDSSGVDSGVEHVNDELSKIERNITIWASTKYRGFGMGGIVKPYAAGGIVGSDGAKIPPLTAASGMVVPQQGRVVPILAHEDEVVANTSQQKNVADWFWKFINNPPNLKGGTPIEIRNIIELDGEVIGEKSSKFIYDSTQTGKAGMGIK